MKVIKETHQKAEKWKWKWSRSVVSDSLRPVDCSLPGSTIHGILQARILECIAISFSRDLSDPGLKPGSPALQADSLPSEPPGTIIREAQIKTTMGHHYQLEMTKIIKGVTISTVKDVKELEISYC